METLSRAVLSVYLTILYVVGMLVLAGCVGTTIEAPRTFLESATVLESSAQSAEKTIGDITCFQYTAARQCAQPGRPLSPMTALTLVDQIAKVRVMVRQSVMVYKSGDPVGNCMGETKSPQACLIGAQSLLAALEVQLREAQK